MNTLKLLWEWLLDSDNRESAQAIGAGLLVVMGGLWQLYNYFHPKEKYNTSEHLSDNLARGQGMNKKKLFLASSAELVADRQQFEIFVNRKNKAWIDQGIFLDLIIWEDFLDAMSQTRLQDEYNQAIKDCDIFVMLFFTKVGKYTEEEFETAFGQFKATNKPFIFTYFKDAAISTGDLNDEVLSLLQFQKKLKNLGHFVTVYKNIEDLQLKFGQQLDKLVDNGFIELGIQHESLPNHTINQTHSGTGNNVAGNQTKTDRQIQMGNHSTYYEIKPKD